MPTAEIPAQTIDPTGVAAGVKRFRADARRLRRARLRLAAAGRGDRRWSPAALIVLSGATADDVAGNPHYYVIRQAIFAVIGVVLMCAGRAHRLLAPARAAHRDLRVPDRFDPRWSWSSAAPRAARAAGSTLAFFPFQPSELGKVLLIVVAVRPSWSIACATGSPTAGRPLRVHGARALPAALVFLQPDLGSALVYVVDRRSPCCSWPGSRGGTSPRSARSSLIAVALVLVGAAGGRRERAPATIRRTA